jgi:hypothetical protein
MSVIEVVLAVIGALTLVGVLAAALWPGRPESDPLPEPDLAAPYRDGLYAAMRIQGVAKDLEHQLYVEAMRHAGRRRTEVLDTRTERDTP